MQKLRVHNFAISLDGYAAGPGQDLQHPLGVDGERLHEWAFATAAFRRMHGLDVTPPDEGSADEGLDDRFIAAGDAGIGATIMGRNMFGPLRGGWDDETWTGWWGEDPPYHHDVFVLTHHPRAPIAMKGGTTFHFVDDGIEVALQRALEAADGADVRLGGGVATVQQYLRAGLVDEVHVAIVPVLLGAGERLFDNLGNPGDLGGPENPGGAVAGLRCVELVSSPSVVHLRLARAAS
jgi:dihydrofolate reductase